ncbi:hypothetical protein GCM10010174_62050 [Kutzneria viridogrisea]|uniref:Uncharacterized protein n=1 Tax=Kutzneria viridogrisea TaxID=47990 RepID=A0ABR6BGV6_9PSEU|nr:hypothetical protein [Kutzneria viridogrisea]
MATPPTPEFLRDYARQLVATHPPLEQWQRDRIAPLLRPARRQPRTPHVVDAAPHGGADR